MSAPIRAQEPARRPNSGENGAALPLPPLLRAAVDELRSRGYAVLAPQAAPGGSRTVRLEEAAPPPRRALHAPDENAPVTGREDW